jgi:hypothetical protein
MKQTNTIHWTIGVVLLMMIIFVACTLVLVKTYADDVATDVDVPNSSPGVNVVYVSSTASALVDSYPSGTITGLIGGSVKKVYINGVVTDLNGDEDLSSVSVAFFRSNHADTYTCSSDANDCYVDNSGNGCSLDTTYGDSTQALFNCPFDIQYYTDATDESSDNYSGTNWTIYVTVTDDDGAYSVDSSVTKDIESFVSLYIPDSIDFGTKSLGQKTTSTDNIEMNIQQYGNMRADVEVRGSDMTCDGQGEIPVNNMKWAKSDLGFLDDNTYNMSGDAADTDFNIGLRSTTEVTKPMYWNIHIPDTGVGGVCSGTTTITAKAAD